MNLPRDHAIHAANIITGITITTGDIRNWTRRGKLTPRPHPRHSTAYNIGELVSLAHQKHERTRRGA